MTGDDEPDGRGRGEKPGPAMKIDDVSASVRSRGPFERAKRWFVLTASRWVVTAILLFGVFGTIVLVGLFGPVPVETFLGGGGISTGAVLTELLKTIVSVVVIVLSINQLVLSPGLGPVGEQRERYEDAMDLRRRIEEHTGERVSPTTPALFFGMLMDEIVEQAELLREATTDAAPLSLQGAVDRYVDAVERDGAYVRDQLGDAGLGEFEVVQALLRFAISEKVASLRALRASHRASLSEEQHDAVDGLEELLELFTISREYIKTIYIRSEYIRLSRGLLYVGLPSLVATYCAIQIYQPTAFPGATLGLPHRLLFVAGAVTVAVTPFTLLVAFVLRLAVLSLSTLFVGPFSAGGRDRGR